MCISDVTCEFILSFDGTSEDNDSDCGDVKCRSRYCLVNKQSLERTSLVILDQLDASDDDLGKLQVPDIASISHVLPSTGLSHLM